MEIADKKSLKRIIVDTDLETHNLIKQQAGIYNMTMKKYILWALQERIKKDKEYGI